MGFEIRPVLSIGVTGHRTLTAVPQIEADLKAIFETVLRVLAAIDGGDLESIPAASRLRLISPLAEGADRLFARAGLATGASLQCPLPFWRAEYEKDFASADSKAEFAELLSRAERVFELNGTRKDKADEAESYLKVGRVVLRHADLLVAVWDGEPPRLRGGTADIVHEALAAGVPVIVVDAAGSKPPVVRNRRRGLEETLADPALRRVLEPIVRPPSDAGLIGEAEPDGEAEGPDPTAPPLAAPRPGLFAPCRVAYSTFLAEPVGRASWAGRLFGSIFDNFVNLVLLRPLRIGANSWIEASRGGWPSVFEGHDGVRATCAPCLTGEAMDAFSRADGLATKYAGYYRSAFIVNFLLSAFAVSTSIMGAAVIGEGPSRVAFDLVELVLIAAVILLTFVANWRNWHERWIEYRHLAEQLRPLRFLYPLGLNLPVARTGRHVLGKERQSAWVDWLVHRVERSLGLPNAVIDSDYLASLRAFFATAVLDDQIAYHQANYRKVQRVEDRLRLLGNLLFWSTGVVCVVAIVIGWPRGETHRALHESVSVTNVLFLISGTFPALGAAVLGIRNVGEFVRLERRSRAVAAALLGAKKDVTGKRGADDWSREQLAGIFELVAAQFMSETAEWRTLVISHRLEAS